MGGNTEGKSAGSVWEEGDERVRGKIRKVAGSDRNRENYTTLQNIL